MNTSLPGLLPQIITMLPPGKFQYASPAAVMAVCLQESEGDPTFSLLEKQCEDNLAVAAKATTFDMSLLIGALKIQSGTYQGKLAKFRFEPGYWHWAAGQTTNSTSLRFLISCSLGVGQQMMRWVLPTDELEWGRFIERFKSDVGLQLTYVVGSLDKLLGETEGDLFRAYKGYNSGNINSKDPQVILRALHVVELRDKIQQQLPG